MAGLHRTINYRGAHGVPVKNVHMIKKGKTRATSMFAMAPVKPHAGEPRSLHRLGKNLH